jgi:hypothetical protein
MMAVQVRPTRSEPGPNTGLRGRLGDEANVGVVEVQGMDCWWIVASLGVYGTSDGITR